nr:flavin reductase family protein [Caulobacter hibisci]
MRQLGASVCVITTLQSDGARAGFTATAVCSLSADPALLLCCVNLSSRSLGVIRRTGLFAVNVLSARDERVARQMASSRSDERFALGAWKRLATGAPILSSALASFDCALDRVVEAGTHAILIGAVREVAVASASASPLLYHDGNYGAFEVMSPTLA